MHTKNTPLVSMIMAAYNGEKYIEGALLSALKQKNCNVDFIVVDDGSTDKTKEIVTSLQEKDDRIQLIQNETNQGMTKTRNIGLSNARGKYIAILDCDDKWIDPLKIQKQVSFLEKHPEIGFLGTNVVIQQKTENGYIFSKKECKTSDEYIKKTLISSNPFAHSSIMYRNVYDKIGGYPENIKYCPDYAYRLKAGKYTKFTNLSDYTTLYNSHPENTSNRKEKSQMIESLCLSRKNITRYPQSDYGLLLKRTQRILHFLLSNLAEEHCPSLKNKIKKIMGRPSCTTPQQEDVQQQKDIQELLFSLGQEQLSFEEY